MVDCLTDISKKINKPSAILIISAHWEESIPTITSGAKPSLIYDYYGFPEASYHINYPCLGEPLLAEKVYASIKRANISVKLDPNRGFDHGVFIPLKIMYPSADIPCVQLSLMNNLNPAEHLKLGQALSDIDYENLLVIGSGFSFHNLKEFFRTEVKEAQEKNELFEAWLMETCSSSNIDELERQQRLIQWEKAPYARFCHPREEHLLPLHVCYGLAQTNATESFAIQILNKKSSMYFWSS